MSTSTQAARPRQSVVASAPYSFARDSAFSRRVSPHTVIFSPQLAAIRACTRPMFPIPMIPTFISTASLRSHRSNRAQAREHVLKHYVARMFVRSKFRHQGAPVVDLPEGLHHGGP